MGKLLMFTPRSHSQSKPTVPHESGYPKPEDEKAAQALVEARGIKTEEEGA
jgi:hypothetical protein